MTRGAGPSPASGLHRGGSGSRGRGGRSFFPGCPCLLCPRRQPAPPQTPLGRKELGTPWGSESKEPGNPPGLPLSCCHSPVCFLSLLRTEGSRHQDSGAGDPTPSTPSGRKEAQKCLLASPWCKATAMLPSTTHFNLQWHPQDPEGTRCQAPQCAWAVSSTGWRCPSLLLHPRSRAPASGPGVDQSPALGGKWQREGRGGQGGA